MNRTVKTWHDFYDAKAAEADWVRAHGFVYSHDVAQNTIADIRQKLKIRPDHTILDVGCGSGRLLGGLLAPGQRGVGLDSSANQIRNAARFGVDSRRIRLVVGRADSLPFPDDSFDRVLCYSVFLLFSSGGYARRALRELIRVCRPGGVVLVGDVTGSVERARAMLHRPFGLETVRAVLMLPPLAPLRWLLWPVRALARAAGRLRGRCGAGDGQQLSYRLYSHGFFKRLGAGSGCGVEILRQDIPGRQPACSRRFDVRLTKR